MSLFKRSLSFPNAAQMIADRTMKRAQPFVSADSALRHSAVWACRRLRADLVSTMPTDIYRDIDGNKVEQKKSVIFVTPGGEEVDWCEWAYSTTDDLDATGNTVGVITARDGAGLPSRIELAPFDQTSIKGKGAHIESFRIAGEVYKPEQIWHEKQYTRPGLAIGLSPIAYAAMSIGGYLSAQEFARDWFMGGGIPSARLKNTAKTVNPEEAQAIKDRFRTTIGNGDLFVHGMDWEYETIQAKASESSFLEQMKFGVVDVCRFLGVPADMIDAEVLSGGPKITYANISQRNLQFLIMHLNPMLRRREAAFSRKLLPQPRYFRFNRAALLEMDLKSRYEAYKIAVDGRWQAPSEIRHLEDEPPFTPAQIAEFSIFAKTQAPMSSGVTG